MVGPVRRFNICNGSARVAHFSSIKKAFYPHENRVIFLFSRSKKISNRNYLENNILNGRANANNAPCALIFGQELLMNHSVP